MKTGLNQLEIREFHKLLEEGVKADECEKILQCPKEILKNLTPDAFAKFEKADATRIEQERGSKKAKAKAAVKAAAKAVEEADD